MRYDYLIPFLLPMPNKQTDPNNDADGTQHLKDADGNTLHRIQEQLHETDCLDTPYGQLVNREVMQRLSDNPPKQ